MKSVRENNLNVQIKVKSNDEIGELSLAFNEMLERIRNLIYEVGTLETQNKEAELKKAVAELDMLQSQINPHFLYNTLDSISMMAYIHKDYETRNMVVALGKLLRLGIFNGDKIIPLKEELTHAKSYITIQKMRYPDLFDISFDIPPELIECRIPKLILQPLIENSLHHGIENKRSKGHIVITAAQNKNTLVLDIIDDGAGMTQERLSQITEQLNSNVEMFNPGSSIGILNVHSRIRLYFKEDDNYGIKILSSSSQGTHIRITLPLLFGSDENNNDKG